MGVNKTIYVKKESMVVDRSKVIAHNDVPLRDIRIMSSVLQRQGQIEPLQVREYCPGTYITCEEDVWGAAIVHAAKALEWPTLLICVVTRYEQ